MLIDIIFLVLMVIALFKGLSRGFIVAIFSLLAFFIGLAAAIKLSAIVSVRLQENINLSNKWLPIISFLLVFFLVAFLVRFGARWIEKTVEFVWLGWLNRLLGVLLYFLLYITLFSIFLFYTVQVNLVKQETIAGSYVYEYIQSMGTLCHECIRQIGALVPRHVCSDRNFFREFSAKTLK